MGLPRLFKLPSNKRFEYKPLYYDPEKERKEERNREIAKELGLDHDKVFVSKMRYGSFRSYHKKTPKVKGSSNILLIVIIIVLFFLSYLILFR